MTNANNIKTRYYRFKNNKYYEKKDTIKISFNDKIYNRQK